MNFAKEALHEGGFRAAAVQSVAGFNAEALSPGSGTAHPGIQGAGIKRAQHLVLAA